MRSDRAHLHQYDQDTRPGRAAFAVCTACGFCAPKRFVLSRYSGVPSQQLSKALRAEKDQTPVISRKAVTP